MSLSIDDVIEKATLEEWKATLLGYCSDLKLSVTSWFTGGRTRTIIAVMSAALEKTDEHTSIMNAGGFLETSARVTQEGGPGWLDIVAYYVFGVTRNPATRGTSSCSVNNTGAAIGPIPVGMYHVSIEPSGNTYTNSSIITLATGNTPVDLICDITGVTDAQFSEVLPVTTYAGVTIPCVPGVSGGLLTTATGNTVESNTALIARGRAKTGAFAPKLGGKGTYVYFATTTTEPGYPLATPITRAIVIVDEITGDIEVVLANSSGAPSGGDVTDMETYLDAVARGDSDTMNATAASNVPIDLVMNVRCPAGYASQLQSDVEEAFTEFIGLIKIGGDETESSTLGVPFNEMENYITRKVTYIRTQSSTLNGGTTSPVLTTRQVATVGTVTATRVGS